ncbi:MAG: T9SS type A sorting domain-containing protein [Chitinophagales bacterium]
MKNKNTLRTMLLQMKCIPVFIFALVVMGLTSRKANAQLYTRTTFNAAYTAINAGSGATVSTATGNDVNQTAIPLGFTFTYAGVNYTTVGLNTNGLLFFDAVAPVAAEGAYNNNMYVSGAGGTDKSISAWWADMTDDASSDILYQTQGTAGSQTFTVQYTNYPHFTGTGGTNVRLNFQVIFYEGTNVIEFRYGSRTITGPPTSLGGACIGIEYGTGGAGNFIDLVTGSGQTSHGLLSPLVAWPSYNYRLTPGAPTPVATGTYNVGIGQTYSSLTLATSDLNHRGISGPVTLNLTDATYDTTTANGSHIFPVFVGPFKGSSSVNTVTIAKTGTPATFSYRGSPVVQGGGFGYGSTAGLGAISNNEEPIMGVCARYTTISNINLVSLGTKASDVETGLMVFESFGGDSGAQYNVFDKITVDMDRTNTSTIGIFSKSITNPGGGQGTNSNNTFRDITIRDSYAGINIAGGTTFDVGNQIVSSSCTTFNSIGDPNVPNDIGGGSSPTYGIWMQNQDYFTIRNNVIRNLSTSSASASVDAILVPAGTGTCEISNNIIRTLKRNNASFGGIPKVCGIRVASPNSSNTFRIFNNSISELLTSYTGVATATRDVRGIYIDDTGSGAITFDIWNNSISIDGSSSPNASNACLEIAEVGTRTFNIKNNVFANFTAAQTGVASHFCIISPTIDKYGVLGSLSDYNDLYIANDQGISGHVGKGATTNYSTLAAWQSGMSFNMGTDANSNSANPFFANNISNLHGTFASAAIESEGTTPPAYIFADIDCQLLHVPSDIGSDDFALCMPEGGNISPASVSVCTNAVYNMSATAFGTDPGITFQWMISGTSGGPYSNVSAGSGATTPSYTTAKLNTGTYYYVLQATCPVSGTDLSNELTVTVKSLPTATITPAGPTTFCKGGSVDLNATVAANRVYQWKKGSSDIAGATLSTYTVTEKGSYKVVVTNTSTGCSKTSAAISITVNNLPTATITPQGPTTFCEGGSVVLQANTGTGYTYKWKKGSSFISGATLSSYTATTEANYKVEVSDGNGCSKLSAATSVSVPCRESENAMILTEESVSIFPNPATAELNIVLPANGNFDFEISSVTGEKMLREQNQNSVDVSDLADGVYFIKIYTADFITTHKFVKQ